MAESEEDEEDFLGFSEEELKKDKREPEILKSSKDKDVLALRGYIYYLNRKMVRKCAENH